MNKSHDIGPGKEKISVTIDDDRKKELIRLAKQSGLSLNAYINALLLGAVEKQAVIMMRPTIIINETKPKMSNKN